jgi:hypothetical protein
MTSAAAQMPVARVGQQLIDGAVAGPIDLCLVNVSRGDDIDPVDFDCPGCASSAGTPARWCPAIPSKSTGHAPWTTRPPSTLPRAPKPRTRRRADYQIRFRTPLTEEEMDLGRRNVASGDLSSAACPFGMSDSVTGRFIPATSRATATR